MLSRIESLWSVSLPQGFDAFCSRNDFDSYRASDGSIISIHGCCIELDEIVSMHQVLADWDIPTCCIPFIGDMHEVVCLDYRESSNPTVVLLDDSRQVKHAVASFEDFTEGVFLEEDKSMAGEDSGVIESESFLDF